MAPNVKKTVVIQMITVALCLISCSQSFPAVAGRNPRFKLGIPHTGEICLAGENYGSLNPEIADIIRPRSNSATYRELAPLRGLPRGGAFLYRQAAQTNFG
jgi:hypothetical protein